MIRFIAAILCACIGLATLPALAHDREDGTEIISAEGVRAIQAAMPEFEREGLDLSKYRVEVLRFGDTMAVLFVDRTAPIDPRVYGGPAMLVAYGVELRRDTFEVIRAHYQK